MENKENKTEEVSVKNRFTAIMLCWFLGFFGVHRLYVGKIGSGFLMMYGTIVSLIITLACPPIGAMCLITMLAFVLNDLAVLALGQFKDCYGNFITSDDLYRN